MLPSATRGSGRELTGQPNDSLSWQFRAEGICALDSQDLELELSVTDQDGDAWLQCHAKSTVMPAKIRIYELAREVGVDIATVFQVAIHLKLPVKSHSSIVDGPAALRIRALLDKRAVAIQSTTTTSTQPPLGDALDSRIQNFVSSLALGGTRQLTVRFLELARRRGDIEFEIGRSKRTPTGLSNFLMLRAGRSAAPVAYVFPATSTVNFRLPREFAFGRDGTVCRVSRTASMYEVTTSMESNTAVDTALELLDASVRRIIDTRPGDSTQDQDNRETYAEIQRLTGAGRYEDAIALARAKGWEHVIASIDRRRSVDQDTPASRAPSSRDLPALERAFHSHLIALGRRCIREAGYRPTIFIQMLQDRGGLATARALLATPNESSGFTELYERRRLDLSLEAVVLDAQWSPLFTRRELETARERLAQVGYAT